MTKKTYDALEFDLFDLALKKISHHKTAIGPVGQKIAILDNELLARFARLRCVSSFVALNPLSLQEFAYAILWEPTEEQLVSAIGEIRRCGKLVVVSRDELQKYHKYQQDTRVKFHAAETLFINNDSGKMLWCVQVYTCRAIVSKDTNMSLAQLRRSVRRIKFDNKLPRERTEGSNFVPIATWNNKVRELLAQKKTD
jgi:hypothetical protein